MCKRIGRGGPLPRLPLRLGCKHRALPPALSPAASRRAPPLPHGQRAPPLLFARPAHPRGLCPWGGATDQPPCAPSPLFHHERRRTARCPLRLSPLLYYIYTRARDTFRPLGGRRSVCPAEGKEKGGEEYARGGEQFLHRVDKPVENQLWISGNRRAFSTAPPRTDAKRWTRPELRAQRRESAARSTEKSHTRGRRQTTEREKRCPCQRKRAHTGTETQHPTANTRLLRTEKGAARSKRPPESPKIVAPLAR